MPTSEAESELRALDLFERLLAYPDNERFRARLLRREPPEVLAALARIEAGHVARTALPTEMPLGMVASTVSATQRIGPFRLTERIGYGGMGEVWRGERDDGLFEQTVAIKLIHAHLHADAAQAFASERRILAQLDHPDIVRLTDGGVTDDGLNYLIMDYVEGVPFDQAIAPLPLDQRVRLFRQAAATVQFAHSRLIAHADLKPSNILVDGAGRVRLLDFGIAGLLAGEGEGRSSNGAMTRAFASPQRLAGAPPSIADDVFALGRMLALVMRSPADADLVAVAAKACADEEADRYETVVALSNDLERWLDGRTVSARAASPGYRLGKFMRRNRTAVLASALAILALIGTTVYATISAVRAERARIEADRRFGEVRSMAKFMMFDLYDQMSGVSGTTAPRADLARISQRYLSNLAATRDAPQDVKVEAIDGFVRVAQIMGAMGSSNLAETKQAVINLDRAGTMMDELLADDPANPKLLMLSGRVAALQCQMKLYGDHDAARALAITEAAEKRIGPAQLNGPFDVTLWRLRQCHGDALTWLNRTKEAVPILTAELAKADAMLARDPKAVDERTLILNYRLLGEAHLYDGNMPDATKVLEQGFDRVNTVFDANPNNLQFLGSLTNIADTLSVVYADGKRWRDSLRVSMRGYQVALAAHERDRADIGSLKSALSQSRNVAAIQAELGLYAEAKALMANTDARWLELVRRYPDQAALTRLYMLSLRPHGDVYRKSGDRAGACGFYRRASEEWVRFDRRWGVSPSDKTEEVAYAAQNLAACDGKGAFHD